MFLGQTRDKIERHAGIKRDGFILMPDETREGLEEVLRGDNDLSMLCSDRAGGKPGIGELIRLSLSKAHAEGRERRTHHGQHAGWRPTREHSVEHGSTSPRERRTVWLKTPEGPPH